MKAQILKFKVRNSKKRLLLIGNKTSSCFAVQLGKTFKTEDALRIIRKVQNGQF